MPTVTVILDGTEQTVDIQTVVPGPSGNFIGSDSDLAAQLDQVWGGPSSGAWLTTPLPAGTSVDTRAPVSGGPAGASRSEQAVATCVQYTTGPLPNGAKPWATVNLSKGWTSTVCIVPYPFPLVPVTPWGKLPGQPWFDNARGLMMKAGVPIPPGLVPTWGLGDTDSEVVIHQPGYKWPGNPNNPVYWGRAWELWGCRNPAQSAPPIGTGTWEAKDIGRVVGTLNRKTGRSVVRTSGADFSNQAYPGWGPDGVGEDGFGAGVVAIRVPNPWTMVTRRDLIRGKIDHPLGFMLPPDPQTANQNAPGVWPSPGNPPYHDSASRPWLPEGSRLRLPAGTNVGSLSIAPLGPGQRRTQAEVVQMVNTAMRDYGCILYDTAGATGIIMRIELGSEPFLPAAFSGNALLNALTWGRLQLMVVGSDSNPNP